MKWIKKGLIFGPTKQYSWAVNSALTPTPLLLNEATIRVYAGFRDSQGISRIGFVDVDSKDPSQVKEVSEYPVLDIGKPGTFDDNGVILGDVLIINNVFYMYYVGFQLAQKVKFLAFTGLAISEDMGRTFCRYSQTPILDRIDDGIYIRAIHSIILENGIWKTWYSAGSDWQNIHGKPYPKYNIRYCESKDGITFPKDSVVCIDLEGDEYRIGRPRVYKEAGIYKMFYTKGTLDQDYIPGYAESSDGISWARMDEKLGIEKSSDGWDSKTLCYPSLLDYKQTRYMFYNGNDMGRDGFGYAVLEKDGT